MRPPAAAWDRAAALSTHASDLLSGVLAAAARGLLPRGPLALPACPRRAAREAAPAALAPTCSDARSTSVSEAAAQLPPSAPQAPPQKAAVQWTTFSDDAWEAAESAAFAAMCERERMPFAPQNTSTSAISEDGWELAEKAAIGNQLSHAEQLPVLAAEEVDVIKPASIVPGVTEDDVMIMRATRAGAVPIEREPARLQAFELPDAVRRASCPTPCGSSCETKTPSSTQQPEPEPEHVVQCWMRQRSLASDDDETASNTSIRTFDPFEQEDEFERTFDPFEFSVHHEQSTTPCMLVHREHSITPSHSTAFDTQELVHRELSNASSVRAFDPQELAHRELSNTSSTQSFDPQGLVHRELSNASSVRAVHHEPCGPCAAAAPPAVERAGRPAGGDWSQPQVVPQLPSFAPMPARPEASPQPPSAAPGPARPEDDDIIGDWCLIVGLVAAKRFNGHCGHVRSYDAHLQRFIVSVHIPGQGSGGQQYVLAKLRRENLIGLSGSREAPPPPHSGPPGQFPFCGPPPSQPAPAVAAAAPCPPPPRRPGEHQRLAGPAPGQQHAGRFDLPAAPPAPPAFAAPPAEALARMAALRRGGVEVRAAAAPWPQEPPSSPPWAAAPRAPACTRTRSLSAAPCRTASPCRRKRDGNTNVADGACRRAPATLLADLGPGGCLQEAQRRTTSPTKRALDAHTTFQETQRRTMSPTKRALDAHPVARQGAGRARATRLLPVGAPPPQHTRPAVAARTRPTEPEAHPGPASRRAPVGSHSSAVAAHRAMQPQTLDAPDELDWRPTLRHRATDRVSS